jgi:hypothetical protein
VINDLEGIKGKDVEIIVRVGRIIKIINTRTTITTINTIIMLVRARKKRGR